MKIYEITALQTRLADMAEQLQLFEKIFDHGDIFLEDTAAQALSEHLTELAYEAQMIAGALEPLKKMPATLARPVTKDGQRLSILLPGNGQGKEVQHGSTTHV